MAKEAKHHRKHLKAITTHKAHDGGFVHEHHYEDAAGNHSTEYGGVSQDMADLHQHMDDHLGPDADAQQAEAPDQGTPDQGGAAPPAATPTA